MLGVEKAGLGRAYAQYQGEQERSLYGAVGGSIANILGILDERKKLSQMEKYKEAGTKTPGVIATQEEYQPLGKFGERIGIDTRTRDVYTSAFTGAEMSDADLSAIGRYETLFPGHYTVQ